MYRYRHYSLSFVLTACFVSACAQNPASKKTWDNIDYSGVYKAHKQREYDGSYRNPTVRNCVDDDLYNCN